MNLQTKQQVVVSFAELFKLVRPELSSLVEEEVNIVKFEVDYMHDSITFEVQKLSQAKASQ